MGQWDEVIVGGYKRKRDAVLQVRLACCDIVNQHEKRGPAGAPCSPRPLSSCLSIYLS